jgi:hypothetical protein
MNGLEFKTGHNWFVKDGDVGGIYLVATLPIHCQYNRTFSAPPTNSKNTTHRSTVEAYRSTFNFSYPGILQTGQEGVA